MLFAFGDADVGSYLILIGLIMLGIKRVWTTFDNQGAVKKAAQDGLASFVTRKLRR